MQEVMAAIGFSVGWAMQKLHPVKRLIRFAVLIILGIAGIRYALPPVIAFVATLPPVSASVVALVAASAFLLFGAAAFAYVLFAFLSRLAQSDVGIRRDFQHIIQKAAHPLKTAVGSPATASTGSFTPYSDDRAFLQEQFDELVKAKILRPDDDLDKILKDGELDLEFLKARGVGE